MGTPIAQVAAAIAAVIALGACGAGSQDQGLADSAAGTTAPTGDRETSTTEAPTSTTAGVSTSNPPSTGTTDAPTTSSTSSPPTSSSTSTSSTSTSTTQPPVDKPGVGAGPIDSSLQPVIDDAVRLLADRESASLSEITVESARTVTWNDGSIGCPTPDGVYTQALVEGSAVELTLRGATYWFHAGTNRQPFLCTSSERHSVG